MHALPDEASNAILSKGVLMISGRASGAPHGFDLPLPFLILGQVDVAMVACVKLCDTGDIVSLGWASTRERR